MTADETYQSLQKILNFLQKEYDYFKGTDGNTGHTRFTHTLEEAMDVLKQYKELKGW